MIFVTIIIFIGLLLVLVLAHEWGHFIAARRAGCRVEEFGFGFPPRIFSFTRGNTRYSLNLLPIGGFVKIEGEDMNNSNPGPESFASKSANWRIIILAAGVAMNVVLAVVVLSIQGVIGVPTLATDENAATLTDHKTYILEIADGSPAAQAGLQTLDRIVSLNGTSDPSISAVQEIVRSAGEATVTLEIERGGQHLTVQVNPRLNPPAGQGALGVSLAAAGLERSPWWQAPWIGLRRTGEMLLAIISQFSFIIGRLVSEGNLGGALTGPIGIAVYTNEAAQLGASYLLEFTALISLNLALINILPFPALDGGRIVFVVLEKILGRRLPGRIESIAHTAGFALLILLMLLITFRDVQRFL